MVEEYINFLNSSKIFSGCIILLMNLGGKYISNEIPKNVDKFFDKSLVRQFIIFSIIFVATKDLKISLLLTFAFIFFFRFILNEKSKFCVLEKSLETISKKEALEAYQTLKKFKAQKI